MIFTQEDFKKIENWLYRRVVKDTQFPIVETITGKEDIPVLQNNINKRVELNDVIKYIVETGNLDIINVMKYSSDRQKISLDEAVELVPDGARKSGLIITFCNEKGNWNIYQFKGVSTTQWRSIPYWENIINELINDLIFFPDEEDLTSYRKDHKIYLKFKDKEYNPEDYSGLGRVILRKSFTDTETCAIDDEDHPVNVLKQEDINNPNTVYIIQYDFDLMGETITVSENCVLWFQGGSLNNGTIVLNDTAVPGIIDIKDIGTVTVSGTYAKGTVLEFKNDSYKSKVGDYFNASTKESSATAEEDPKNENETFYEINESAYSDIEREELRWWNGSEWVYLLDSTDYKELKSIIDNLIVKHNAEISACYKYFKKRCAELEKRMLSAENRITANEANIVQVKKDIQANKESIDELKADKENILDILDPAASTTNEAVTNIQALGEGYNSLIAVIKTIKDFLTGTDADNTINKLKELEAFLNSITEEQTLSGLLEQNLNSAKSYTDSETAKCVKLGINEVAEDLDFKLSTNTDTPDSNTEISLHTGTTGIKGKIVNISAATTVIASSKSNTNITVSESEVSITENTHKFTFPDEAGVIALHSEIPTNYVTTDTEQTITANKTFADINAGNITSTGTVKSSSGFKTENTSYEEGKIRLSDNEYTLPEKSGKIALDEDVQNKIDKTTDDTISGTKTFENIVTGNNGFTTSNYYIAGTTKYGQGSIINGEYTAKIPEKNGTFVLAEDVEEVKDILAEELVSKQNVSDTEIKSTEGGVTITSAETSTVSGKETVISGNEKVTVKADIPENNSSVVVSNEGVTIQSMQKIDIDSKEGPLTIGNNKVAIEMKDSAITLYPDPDRNSYKVTVPKTSGVLCTKEEVGNNMKFTYNIGEESSEFTIKADSNKVGMAISDKEVFIGFEGGNINLKAKESITVSQNPTVSSDIRLKENIVTIEDNDSRLKSVENIDLKAFNYKKSKDQRIGYIAQEVQEVLPEIVSENSEGFLSINYMELIMLKIKALECEVKELREKLSEKADRITF